MAHSENFSMKEEEFSLIWEDVKPLIIRNDLSFANIESPVIDTMEWKAYPLFNMHSSYVQEAVNSGFNVFSIVNNHINDQGLEGIYETRKLFQLLKDQSAESARPVYFSGIKKSREDQFNYTVIEKNGFKILFLAVTELLNQNSYKSYLNFVNPDEKSFEILGKFIKDKKTETNSNLFILSLHTSEEEYVSKVSDKRKKMYRTLLNSGCDILWANHPHVIREYELFGNKQTGNLNKIIFYGNGNTISGQRRSPVYTNPENPRDYTGDGLLFEVKLVKKYNKEQTEITIENYKSHFITTYIDSKRRFLLRNLDAKFIQSLKDKGKTKEEYYFTRRKEISENTKETIIWE